MDSYELMQEFKKNLAAIHEMYEDGLITAKEHVAKVAMEVQIYYDKLCSL